MSSQLPPPPGGPQNPPNNGMDYPGFNPPQGSDQPTPTTIDGAGYSAPSAGQGGYQPPAENPQPQGGTPAAEPNPYGPPAGQGQNPYGQPPVGAGQPQSPYAGQPPAGQPPVGNPPPPGGVPPYGTGYAPGQPPYGSGPTSTGMVTWPGIVALVCGILALLGAWIPIFNFFSLMLALAGLGFGIYGLVIASKGRAKKGMALTGLITSILAVVVFILSYVAVGLWADDMKKNPDKYISALPTNFPTETESPGSGSTSSTAPGGKAIQVSGKLGETLKLNSPLMSDTEVTLVEIKEDVASSIPAPTGKRFVAAHFKVKNNGTKQAMFLNDSKATTDAQFVARYSFMKPVGLEPLKFVANLKPGEQIEGWSLFEVPTGQKVTSISLDVAEWKLS